MLLNYNLSITNKSFLNVVNGPYFFTKQEYVSFSISNFNAR